MIEKQSKEEVERVMDGAAGGGSGGLLNGEGSAASVAALQALQTENNRCVLLLLCFLK